MTSGVTRVVALGASNLTFGIQTVFATARSAFGRDIEVLAALGYGRSYGALSNILGVRTLPGVLQSGLWRELNRRPQVPTRGVITDVGIDILYGVKAAQLVAWVEEAVDRLQAHTRDIVLTDLPVSTIARLRDPEFLFFRSLFFPPCRLSRETVVERTHQVSEGLARLAEARGLRFVRLSPDWYLFDPIHFKPTVWRSVWREIMLGEARDDPGTSFSALEWAELQARAPERQWLLRKERAVPQAGIALRKGGRFWLF